VHTHLSSISPLSFFSFFLHIFSLFSLLPFPIFPLNDIGGSGGGGEFPIDTPLILTLLQYIMSHLPRYPWQIFFIIAMEACERFSYYGMNGEIH
jgi:hypothetical protein